MYSQQEQSSTAPGQNAEEKCANLLMKGRMYHIISVIIIIIYHGNEVWLLRR